MHLTANCPRNSKMALKFKYTKWFLTYGSTKLNILFWSMSQGPLDLLNFLMLFLSSLVNQFSVRCIFKKVLIISGLSNMLIFGFGGVVTLYVHFVVFRVFKDCNNWFIGCVIGSHGSTLRLFILTHYVNQTCSPHSLSTLADYVMQLQLWHLLLE